MLMAVTFLTLLARIPFGVTIFRSCVPNTQFLLNGRLCSCNSMGQSNDASCQMIGRRQSCQPGQIIWEECSQCICQENGKLLCTNTECVEEVTKTHLAPRSGFAIWCTPFRSYYINCTLCVCPISGKMSEARCAKDSSCILKGPHTSLDTIPQKICIPKVMYLFTCLHCLCSDDGFLLKSKCVETCHKPSESNKRCIPKTFYKADCNICRCPENGSPDNSICSKSTCNQHSDLKSVSLYSLRNKSTSCTPNKYTKPRCIYCECNSQGVVNEQNCLEQECLQLDDFNYESVKSTCSPGEMVPTCMECFCPRSKLTIEKYCTRVCSSQNKLVLLEHVLKRKLSLIDRNIVKETVGTDSCDPNSLFLDEGRYCLCSEDGNTSSKHCTSVLEDTLPKKPSQIFDQQGIRGSRKIDFNVSCEPNTFVEFGCNSCYCSKHGTIDAKWCTTDDCEAKKVIQENNSKTHSGTVKILKDPETAATCVPGSLAKLGCNFCICGPNGLVADRVCTKNPCNRQHVSTSEDLVCDSSSYYTVDCNICFCPSDGIKNVDKCTKNQCETNFLRSDSCTSGHLFSHDCDICICPPNGNKRDKVCTNRTCATNDTPWKKIFRISQNLLGNDVKKELKSFEPCFPGEEFEMGCKVCMCPDMGLKEYATCTTLLCDTQTTITTEEKDEELDQFKEDRNKAKRLIITRRQDSLEDDDDHHHDLDEFCQYYNITGDTERVECTPGSEYIVRCKICVCPYMGSINNFCRPMPANRYCEQAYPGFNYMSMGRRSEDGNTTANNSMPQKMQYPFTIHVPHNHTKYSCNASGRLEDDCFMCECKNKIVIEEHCYKSDASNCTDVTAPSFIKMENRLST